MRSHAARPTTGLLLAVLLGSVACQSDRLTGPPPPSLATAAAAWSYAWFTAGADHSCLSRAPAGSGDRTLLCWGNNNVGQLGIGSAGGDRLTPTAVLNNTGSILAVGDGGNAHHCAISNGRAYCWGWNPHGQLGDGTTTNRSAPTLVQGGITWSQIATGYYHTCGVNNIGVAYCWGRGADGALGNGTTGTKLVPTPVSTGVAFWALQAGSNFTCGRSRSFPATIYCWGDNGYGQLGIGSFTDQLKPGPAVVGGAKWQDLALGWYHVCAVTYTATPPVYCWGSNWYGELGNGQTTPRNQPHAVTGGIRMHPLVAGFAFSCGRRVDNSQMLCWGRGAEGQLGNGFFVDRLTPYPVYGSFTLSSSTSGLAAGDRHVIAQRNDGSVVAWGQNNHGQLGNGTLDTKATPVVILPP